MMDVIRREIGAAQARQARPGVGIVRSYDPGRYAVKLQMQPGGQLTGWLPVGSPWVGAGWGLFTPPSPGEVMEIQYQGGDHGAPYACARFWTAAVPPLPVPAGEAWMVHASGAALRLNNDGKLTLTDKAGSALVLQADGTALLTCEGGLTVQGDVTVRGTVVASGDISDQGGARGSVASLRSTYDGHTHGGVQAGGGSTSGPSGVV